MYIVRNDFMDGTINNYLSGFSESGDPQYSNSVIFAKKYETKYLAKRAESNMLKVHPQLLSIIINEDKETQFKSLKHRQKFKIPGDNNVFVKFSFGSKYVGVHIDRCIVQTFEDNTIVEIVED